MFEAVEKRFSAAIDWPLLFLVTALCAIGLGVLYSAGYDSEKLGSLPMQKQAVSMGMGAALFFLCMFFKPGFWRRWSFIFYLIGCVLLGMILVKGVVAGGSRRWLELGPLRLQASELMKIFLIMALAKVFSSENSPTGGYTFKSLWLPCIVIFLPAALILVEPDLGTALGLVMIGGSMLLVAGIRGKTFKLISFYAIVLAIPAWFFLLKDYQKRRIMTFLNPESDPLGSGYHAIQSQIAVGSGSLLGKGFFKGTQTQLRFLPEQTTDFIFSVLAEEWGFVGSVAVVIIYGFLIYRLLKISSRCEDRFVSFVAIGMAALIFWQVVVNIGMVIGVMPVVGLTLPLLSYGGSSVLAIMLGLGLVGSMSKRRYQFSG